MSKRSRRQERIILAMKWYRRIAMLYRPRHALVLRPVFGHGIYVHRKFYLPRFGLR